MTDQEAAEHDGGGGGGGGCSRAEGGAVTLRTSRPQRLLFFSRRCPSRQDFVAHSWPKRRFDDWLNHAESMRRQVEKCLQMRPYRGNRRRPSSCLTRPVTPEVAGFESRRSRLSKCLQIGIFVVRPDTSSRVVAQSRGPNASGKSPANRPLRCQVLCPVARTKTVQEPLTTSLARHGPSVEGHPWTPAS
jgi:hypothetical protein